MQVDKDKAIKAIVEYIAFVSDCKPTSDESAEKFDRKRKAYHEKVIEAFGGKSDNTYRENYNVGDVDKLLKYFDGNIEEAAKFAYYRISDATSTILFSHIETAYTYKYRIDKWISSIEKNVNALYKQCDDIFDAFKKDQCEYNKDKPYKKQNTKSFSHEYNRAKSQIRFALEKMKLLSKFPIEAYLMVAVKEYFLEPEKDINREMNCCRAEAFKCKMYHDSCLKDGFKPSKMY